MISGFFIGNLHAALRIWTIRSGYLIQKAIFATEAAAMRFNCRLDIYE